MGRRPIDAEGKERLAAEQFGEIRETLADRLGDEIHCRRVRLKAVVAHGNDSIETSRGSADNPLRTLVEAAPRTFVRELDGLELLVVTGGAMPMRLEQAQRTPKACNARREFAGGDGRVARGLDGKDLEHAAQLGAGVVNKS
jgi:hypothetical protein